MCSLLSFASPCLSRCSPQKTATRHSTEIFILGQRSRTRRRATSRRRISVFIAEQHQTGFWADGDKKGGLALQCDKNDYRGILAGLEGVSGKRRGRLSETMTVKN